MIPETHYGWEEAQSSLITFNKGEVLFGAMRPYQHKVSLAPFDGITRTTTFVIRPKLPEYYAYLFLTLFQPSTIEYATLICNGADRPYAVWNRGFEKLPIWIPERGLAGRFETLVRPILDALMQQYFVVRMLAKQRNALLPRLISGKLRVDQLDIQYPPSMTAEPA
jgi:type I restriction enzyme S subunit